MPSLAWHWVGRDPIQHGTNWFAVGCVVSCLCIAYILATYHSSGRHRALNRRPGSLLVLRAWFELAFCVGVLLSLANSSLNSVGATTVDECLHAAASTAASAASSFADRRRCIPGCEFSAAWLQFFEIGSEGYFVVIAVDLLLNTLPSQAFHDSKHRLPWYHAYVLGISCLTSSALVLTDRWAPSDHILQTVCWHKSFGSWQGVERLLPETWDGWLGGWAEVYVLYFLYYTLAVVIVAWAAWRLKRGLPRTLATRERRIKEGGGIVGIFLVYLMLQIVLYLYIRAEKHQQIGSDDASGHRAGAKHLLAFVLGARGLADVVVWKLVVMPRAVAPLPSRRSAKWPFCRSIHARWKRFVQCIRCRETDGGLTEGMLHSSSLESSSARVFQLDVVQHASGEDSMELNVALQQEILCFLLLGLRTAASAVSDDEELHIDLAAAALRDREVTKMRAESELLSGQEWTQGDLEESVARWNFSFTSYHGSGFRKYTQQLGLP